MNRTTSVLAIGYLMMFCLFQCGEQKSDNLPVHQSIKIPSAEIINISYFQFGLNGQHMHLYVSVDSIKLASISPGQAVKFPYTNMLFVQIFDQHAVIKSIRDPEFPVSNNKNFSENLRFVDIKGNRAVYQM
jgi:hypothetical protein